MGKITQEDLDAAKASDDPIATLAARKEAKSGNSFSQAFAAARAAGDKAFTWNGKSYTTEVAKAGGPGRKPTGPAPSVGAGRGGRGGPTADELDSYASAKQRAKDKAEAEWAASKRPGNAEMERDAIESSHPEAMLIGGPGIKAVAGAARALAAKTAAKAAPTAARSAPRAIAEAAPEASAPTREAVMSRKAWEAGPRGSLGKPASEAVETAEAEAPARGSVMNRKNWEEGPRGELGDNARDRIMDRDFWARGPSAELKKGGKVKTYAKGGAVKGWGQARGARGAKIV